MKKLSILALALSILAVSCNKEAGKGDPGGAAGEIRVSATVNGITKATTDGGVTTFVNGDQLSLYVWTGENTAVPASPWINGEVNTYNWETKMWNPANLMLWQNGTDPHYFLGVFPARAITNFTADPFEQAPSYEASDLLVGTILGDGVVATTDPIPLVMDHLMAQLKVALTFRNQWSGAPEVRVYVKAAYTGTVDYLSKTITPGNDIATFGFDGLGEGFQTTLIIPQEGVTEITVMVNGTKYVYTHPTSIPLTKGHVTTLPLVVGKDVIELDGDVTVEGWTAGELPEGLGGDAVVAPKVTDLGTITADYVAQDGYTLTGTLDVVHYPVKISIAAGATVTLNGVTINGVNESDFQWAGLNCEGNATIILKDGTTNTVKGFYANWAGIYMPEGCTLTIQGETLGTGKLIASSNGYGCGIGGGWNLNGASCGNINIEGGNVTATGGIGGAGIGGGNVQSCGAISITGGTITSTGGRNGAGIGSGRGGSCVSINISGGTVTATGGENAAGIGGGGKSNSGSSCGDITITSDVTKVTATKGENAPNSIGAAEDGTCGTVTIGGVVYPDGVSESPFVYLNLTYPVALSEVTSDYVGSVITAENAIVYKTAADAEAASETAVAIITYVGSVGSVDASSETYKGLALALADANGGNEAAWSSVAANCLDKQYGSEDDPTVDMSGIANTDILVSDDHDHDAAYAARNYNGGTHPAGTSEWFLPSAGQWQKMITAAGSYANLVSNANLKSQYAPYWSSTEKGNGSAWTYTSVKWDSYGGTSFSVRACLAF